MNKAESEAAASGGRLPIHTVVPYSDPIELVAYYDQFVDYYPECELQTKRWCSENIGHDWAIIDAGANVGYYSLLFSRLAPEGRIWAFEPTTTIDLLKRNLASAGATNVTALGYALGVKSGEREDDVFRIWGAPAEHKLYPFKSIDDFVAEQSLQRLDLIKIDVDSFDFEVLRGAEKSIARFDPWIVIELNHALAKRNQSPSDAFRWLLARGFRQALVLDDENFVFRRRNQPHSAAEPSLKLIFETRPILICPSLARGRQVENAFGPLPHGHNNARVATTGGSSSGFEVWAPGPRWSFAASLVKSGSAMGNGTLIVEIDVEVIEGTIGIGGIAPDFKTYVGQEQIVHPTNGPATIRLDFERLEAVHSLMFRNTDEMGKEAHFNVIGLRSYAGVPAENMGASSILRSNLTSVDLSTIGKSAPRSADFDVPDDALRAGGALAIVDYDALGTELGFGKSYLDGPKIIRKRLADFKMEAEDAPILRYIYANAQPRRHLEFGTWEGFGATLCAASCAAEIWTVNLPHGEIDASGTAVYRDASDTSRPSDAGAAIGWRYRAAGFADRVHQILCDSRVLDIAEFGEGFFDTILVDGGHTRDMVENDTEKALYLLKSGGILLWHDFCPDEETLRDMQSPRGVVAALIANWSTWQPRFKKIFWVRPSWLLVGIKV